MAVVISDFEVLPEPQQDTRKAAADAAGAAAPPDKIEPSALAAAQRALHARALRLWAH